MKTYVLKKNWHHLQISFWLKRISLPLIAIILFVVTNHVYNLWSGLTFYFLIRRTIVTLGLGVLLFGPAVLLRRKARLWYLIIVSLPVCALMATEFVYARYAGGFLSVSALKYFWQAATVGGSVRSLLSAELWFFFITPPILLIGYWLFSHYPEPGRRLHHAETLMIVALGLAVIAGGYGYIFIKEAREQGDISRLVNHPYNSDELVKKVGIVNYSIYDAVKYALRKKSLTSDELGFINRVKPKYQFKATSKARYGLFKGKNVVYLQLESFQQYLIGKSADGQELTPNLNQLAAASRQYTNFHYTIGPGTSSDSEFTALNSLMHLGDAAVLFDYPNNRYHALPSLLKEHGYITVAMHGDSGNFWNRANAYPSFGYERYDTLSSFKLDEKIIWGVSDRDFFRQALPRLSELKQPFWSHVITLSSHSPFQLPPQYQTLTLDSLNLSPLQKNYLEAVHYTDTALGEFMTAFRASELAANTILVVTGDHEPFIATKDDLNYAKFLGYPNGFDDLTFLHSKQVPFLIYASGSELAGLDPIPSSPLDIYPTISNLLGIDAPLSVLGHDLFNDPMPVATRRRRGAGIEIEMIITGGLNYAAAVNSSRFEDGACYNVTLPVELSQCLPLYNDQMDRYKLSDLVVKGNRLDLIAK